MLNVHKKNDFPAIIAHRGASYHAPENTLAAVRLAWELDADGVEIDVHLTPDKRIVVIHDATTKRTAKKNLTVGVTPSTELRNLDAGIVKFPKCAGQKIPFIEEILTTLPDNKKLFIEIKCGKEIVPLLRTTIIKKGKISQIVIMGFDLDTVSGAKKIMPELPVYWLVNTRTNGFTRKFLPYDSEIITRALASNIDGLSARYPGITGDFAEMVKSSGLELYAWTVNSHKEAVRLTKLGVDGIITNRPGWLANKLKQHVQTEST